MSDTPASLYSAWTKAIETANGNPTPVLDLYHDDATLLPTFSNGFARTSNLGDQVESMSDYFAQLTKKKALQVKTLTQFVQDLGEQAIVYGQYEFHFVDDNDQPQCAEARYTFVCTKLADGSWSFMHHHSSLFYAPTK